MNEKQLARMIVKHGLSEVLDAIVSICQERAEELGSVAQQCQHEEYREEGFRCAAVWQQSAREIRSANTAIYRYKACPCFAPKGPR